MAIKKYDLVAVTGTYTDSEGMEKRRFMNCGAVFEGEKGMSLKLEALPIGSDGWFYLYEPRPPQSQHGDRAPRSQQRPQPQPQQPTAKDPLFSEDPPF